MTIQINLLPSHTRIRAIFYINYIPESFGNIDNVKIIVDSSIISQIFITDIKKSAFKQKESCNGFGAGYYSIYKVITPYFDHSSEKINVTLIAKSGFKMGAS